MKTKFAMVIFLFAVKLAFSQAYYYDMVVSGLTQPTVFTFLPNNNVIIVQKGGLVLIKTLTDTLVSTDWDFTDSTLSAAEQGLIGVTLDPDYSANHFIYFYYIHNSPRSYRIVRTVENNNHGSSPLIIFDEPDSYPNNFHVGGNLRFGPAKKLFVSIGDNNVDSASQSLYTFKGKILRINPNGTIPTDNPFYDDGNPHTGKDDRIWAYGLRNSFDFCFSPFNDSLYASENSSTSPDEVNYIRKGKNYGWPLCQGYCNPHNPAFQDPLTEIKGFGATNFAPTGILIYNGNKMPELYSKLLVVSFACSGPSPGLLKCNLINAPDYDSIDNKVVISVICGATTLAQGQDGYIYILQYSSGSIWRLSPNTTGIEGNQLPSGFYLSQNYPNPFNPVTEINYSIPANSFVNVKVYDVNGREVAQLINETKTAGNYSVTFDASAYPSGVYFYRLTAGEVRFEKKMVLIK